jgi:hypothetical protein
MLQSWWTARSKFLIVSFTFWLAGLPCTRGQKLTCNPHSTKPGLFPQYGKLVGTTEHEVILGLDDSGVQLHFPKIGYVVREAGNAKL